MNPSIYKYWIAFLICFHGSYYLCVAQSPKEITNSVGMKLVLIPKGSFIMGSPASEKGRRGADETQHEVTLTNDYYLGVFEVTQAQYKKVMGENPSYFEGSKVPGDSNNHPVDCVKWEDAVAFCKKLSDLPEEKEVGRIYRLPTEAEWEYACRAGSKTTYYFHDDSRVLPINGWYIENSSKFRFEGRTHPHAVGQLNPNAWGLYDMHGNVKEWCIDWSDDYPKGAVSNPTGPSTGFHHVVRGGAYNSTSEECRCGYRDGENWPDAFPTNGFRIALSPPNTLRVGEELKR
jgi:formylglycine-generating enzyme required for sulfatase activity